MPVPVSLWCFVGAVLLCHATVPFVLRGLQAQAPDIYQQLGAPQYKQIFSRYQGNWRLQFHFMRYLLSGRIMAKTSGWPRVAALICMGGYATALVSLAVLLLAIIHAANS